MLARWVRVKRNAVRSSASGVRGAGKDVFGQTRTRERSRGEMFSQRGFDAATDQNRTGLKGDGPVIGRRENALEAKSGYGSIVC